MVKDKSTSFMGVKWIKIELPQKADEQVWKELEAMCKQEVNANDNV